MTDENVTIDGAWPRAVWFFLNAEQDNFPSVSTADLGVRDWPGQSIIEISVVWPFVTTVLAKITKRRDRAYINLGWGENEVIPKCPCWVEVDDVLLVWAEGE